MSVRVHYEVTTANRDAVHLLLAQTVVNPNELRKMKHEQLANALRFGVLDGRIAEAEAARAVGSRSPTYAGVIEAYIPEEAQTGDTAKLPILREKRK